MVTDVERNVRFNVKYAFWWGKCTCVFSVTGELRYDILMDSLLELFHICELENVKD